MRILRVVAGAAAALALGAAAARAQPLTVVEVNAPAVNCVFHPACIITVSDSVGFIPLPYLAAPNTAFLQSRTFSGAPGTPAAGRAGYMYRISLTQAGGSADCLGGLVLNTTAAQLPALALYRSLGFREIGRSYLDVYELVWMRLPHG